MDQLRNFRDCLGKFATGVTVVTCRDAAGVPVGITVNSFSSVSLEPPLILWNIAKVSRALDAYLAAEHFGISVLTAAQEPLSAHFARSDNGHFDNVDHDLTERGVPRLADALAWFECRTFDTHDCGDHFIIVGEVIDYEAAEGQPLLFFAGQYAALDSS